MGGDLSTIAGRVFVFIFLLTPPRGGRRSIYKGFFKNVANFYSRPRVGGDESAVKPQPMLEIFLLTPPRGGRLLFLFFKGVFVYFYSRPRVGGDYTRELQPSPE